MFKNKIRSTKIVATMGPASSNRDSLSRMIDAGMNVARLNFSHGSHEDHRSTIELIREVSNEKGVSIGILQDLQGPKIRVAKFETPEGVFLERDQEFIITMDDVVGNNKRVGTTYKQLARDVSTGMILLLDDGNMAVEVVSVQGNDIYTKVLIAGTLKNNKGINVPQADLSVPALSDKDVLDLRFGAEMGVDWVALSFVRSKEDLLLARHYLSLSGSSTKLMAKIEKPQAVKRFSEILEVADGIMVARGDLGVEMYPEQVPRIQKSLIQQCREAGKPVITATQMLESMINNPRPTRAEASDVANAIYDGTDAVMLSAESAVGQYPVEAVSMMSKIALEVENSEQYEMLQQLNSPIEEAQDAIASAVCKICSGLKMAAIVAFTSSGGSSARISKYRPSLPILALTPSEIVRNQQTLLWGVMPILSEDPENSDDMVRIANEELIKRDLAKEKDRFIMTAGVPFGIKGTTNMMRVEKVKQSILD